MVPSLDPGSLAGCSRRCAVASKTLPLFCSSASRPCRRRSLGAENLVDGPANAGNNVHVSVLAWLPLDDGLPARGQWLQVAEDFVCPVARAQDDWNHARHLCLMAVQGGLDLDGMAEV